VSAKTCEICGANTPYTDWTRCEKHNTKLADADRIAQLTAEHIDNLNSALAQTRRERDEAEEKLAASRDAHERTVADRNACFESFVAAAIATRPRPRRLGCDYSGAGMTTLRKK
jgi:hypothetical protein